MRKVCRDAPVRDADIIDLRKNYAFMGMKVIIKCEMEDDLPFEIRAMHKQHVERLRHLDPAIVLTNEMIQAASAEQGRVKKAAQAKPQPKKR